MSFLRRLTKKNSTPGGDVKGNITGLPQNPRDVNVPSRTLPTRRPPAVPVDNDAPPAYSPPANDGATPAASQQSTSAQPVARAAPAEDSPYHFLTQFDTIFLIDDSGSMAGRSWRETSEALQAIAPICTQYDADGIDIYFLNHRLQRSDSNLGGYTNVTSTAAVREIFSTVRPGGGTPTATRLNHILKPYLAAVENDVERQAHGHEPSVKPLNIIVITDGVPSDDVESVIVQAARKLDKYNAEPWQVGIQFFQVGQEPEAAEELKQLDDALASQHNIRDMVDTIPWNGQEGAVLTSDFLLKCVLGAVNKRLDRRRVA